MVANRAVTTYEKWQRGVTLRRKYMFEKIGELENINSEIGDVYNIVRLLQDHLINDMRYTEHDKVAAICLYKRMPMYQSTLNIVETMLNNLDTKSNTLASDMYSKHGEGGR